MKVSEVAKLARIELTDEEASRYQGQIDHILQHIEQLLAVDVEGIEPTAHAGAVYDVVREDEVSGQRLTQEQVLDNAPATAQDQIRLPQVV